MLTTRVVCLVGLLLLASALAQAQRRQLHYRTETVRLTGRLVYRTFYGQPNYGETPKTDSRETQPILILDSMVKVTDKGNDHGNDPDEYVRVITLVAEQRGGSEGEEESAFRRSIKRFVGKRVVVWGGLFHAETGHHHTKVLMEVYSIKRMRRT